MGDELTKEIINNFISLYIRFLKNKNIFFLIREAFILNNNRADFLFFLSRLRPNDYFASFGKGWYWDNLRHKISRKTLEKINDEWIRLIRHTQCYKYNWSNVCSIYNHNY